MRTFINFLLIPLNCCIGCVIVTVLKAASVFILSLAGIGGFWLNCYWVGIAVIGGCILYRVRIRDYAKEEWDHVTGDNEVTKTITTDYESNRDGAQTT